MVSMVNGVLKVMIFDLVIIHALFTVMLFVFHFIAYFCLKESVTMHTSKYRDDFSLRRYILKCIFYNIISTFSDFFIYRTMNIDAVVLYAFIYTFS